MEARDSQFSVFPPFVCKLDFRTKHYWEIINWNLNVKVEEKLQIKVQVIHFHSETDHIGSFLLEEIIRHFFLWSQ